MSCVACELLGVSNHHNCTLFGNYVEKYGYEKTRDLLLLSKSSNWLNEVE